MTNREKYINNATDEELALMLNNTCDIKDNKIIIHPVFKEEAFYTEKIKNWLSKEAELTADEMFKELGYIKFKENRAPIICIYDKFNGDYYTDKIVIEKTHFGFYYIKHRISSKVYFSEEYIKSKTITEAEDKAIHKKIEELKKE